MNKLEGMFKDVASSNELNTVFKNSFSGKVLSLQFVLHYAKLDVNVN